ncbi:serine-protein kinase ATM isoform X6 [Marmota monax]|uniref:serine-protein kinase ATM isoform X6 n=1 Tax=Marmota monax TaxID=9995 RepID=UPI0026F30C51|nr:serine-protein kinase ATM isoform X6 [Marmota monax]
MSLALNDLLICCRQLEHDRATERRKEIEKFKRLIRDPETVQHLDRHSDSKQGKYLNWDAVFRFLQKYIQKETECLRTAKPNVSASTQTSRQKKMQEISSLVRYFIKCANKRAPRLKCHELLNYIMDTVKDSSNGVIYGADCSNILLKDILSVRKYWCEISQQQWLGRSQQFAMQKRITRSGPYLHPDFTLPFPRNVRNKFLLFISRYMIDS